MQHWRCHHNHLATQLLPGRTASLVAIEASVPAALADADTRGLTSLGIPDIGYEIVGPGWPRIRAILATDVGTNTDVDLIVVSQSTDEPRRTR